MTKGKVREAVPPAPTLSEQRKAFRGHWPQNNHLRTHMTYPKVYTVAVGDMSKGFIFYGPFVDSVVAIHWANENLKVGETVQVYPMSHVRGVRGEVE